MKFEWDPAKAALNIQKRGVSFEEAARASEHSLSATFPDPDYSRDEFRLITYGLGPKGKFMVVSHTERGDTVRIVSARQATENEGKRHKS